jgi:hypothetical protein
MYRLHLSLFLIVNSAGAHAGVYYSPETPAPLPAQWRGFLLEHRALRLATVAPAAGMPVYALREQYEEATQKLSNLAEKRALSATEAADLGALHLRLGRPAKALDVLRTAQRTHPTHFPIAANLGTAWHLHGDLAEADRALTEAIRLAPAKDKPFEEAHQRLVRLRMKEPKNTVALDDLFGVNLLAPKLTPAERTKLPPNDVAIAQQLALWLPTDARLLWLVGELAAQHGDVRTAANILEGCVTEMALTQPTPRQRRQDFRTQADAIAKLPDAEHAKYKGDIVFASTRPLVRIIDLNSLPAIRPDGVNALPWLVLNETTIEKPYRPKFLKHLEQLDGKTISMTGFMQPLSMDLEVAGFMLLEHPVGCWFCETPEPAGIIFIDIKEGKTVPVKRGRIKIEGTLKLNRTDPEDFLYSVAGARISDPD